MIKCEVCIIGGGIAGLMTAVLLGQSGIEVTVVEQYKLSDIEKIKPSGRTSALMQGSLRALEQAGVWDNIKPHCAPLETLRIIDGETRTDFCAGEIDLPYFGQNVPNDLLKAALLEKARGLPSVSIMDETGLWDFEEKQDHMVLRLNDDREIRAQLLIGADGKDSAVRQIAGISAVKTAYHQSAITCLINHSKSHDNASTEFHKNGGPFTLVPCPGNQSAVVWCEPDGEAEELIKLKKSDFEQALQDQTQNIIGEITLETSPESWKLKGLVARKLVGHRLVLIAEAAHALHPIGAQGLNLSLRDVKAITKLLIKQKSLGLDLGDLHMLKRYKGKRRADTYARFAGVTGLNSLISFGDFGVPRLRRAGLSLLGRSDFLRKQAIKIGLGTKQEKAA